MKTVGWFKWLSVASFVLAQVSVAEESTVVVPDSQQPAATSAETVVAPVAFAPSFSGAIDIRPTMTQKPSADNSFGTENTVDLSYAFDPNTSVMYRQEINTNLYTPGSANVGLNPQAGDGIIRGFFNNLWTDSEQGLSLNYEIRGYLPTNAVKRDAGMITAIRNYVKLKADLGAGHQLQVMEAPIFHIYERALSAAGKANPAFENRVVLEYQYKVGKFTFLLPVWLASVKLRDGAWTNDVYLYPEIDYAIDQTFTVGVAAYNNVGFLKTDWARTGAVQLTLQAAL